MSQPLCCQYDFGTPEYDMSVDLRYRVLRQPLGLTYTEAQLAAEWDQWHLGCFSANGNLLACLVLQPSVDGQMKMRQVAVEPECQGQGLGVVLVGFSERLAFQRGYTEMVLHARETAVAFYLKLGYDLRSETFEEVGIPHRKLGKALYAV